jgi:HNH endonuclease
MAAFTYPARAHQRRHGPQGYADYESYRPWLRDDFTFRCVYCLLREQWGRVRGMFDLDHFLPVSQHSEWERTYDNLLYSCATCNAVKGKRVLPDPSQVLIAGDVWVGEDGRIQTGTRAARRLIRVLGLDDPEYTEFRLLWMGIISLAEQYDRELYRKLMGFPNDLPNLARLKPPGGNTRPEGVRASHFARRKGGTLPDTY